MIHFIFQYYTLLVILFQKDYKCSQCRLFLESWKTSAILNKNSQSNPDTSWEGKEGLGTSHIIYHDKQEKVLTKTLPNDPSAGVGGRCAICFTQVDSMQINFCVNWLDW